MKRTAPFGHMLNRMRRLTSMAVAGICAVQTAQAATYVATFTGIADTNFYYDPYYDPAYTYYATGPFKGVFSLTFPFDPVPSTDPDYTPPQPFDFYSSDPVLGPLHTFFFPDPFGGYLSSSFTLGLRSFSFGSSNGEGSSFDIGVTSLTDLFPSIVQPSAVDVDVTGTFRGISNYYKEPQYGLTEGRITHLTISVFPSVPEPASWAMMIVGFGAIGIACRRRTRPIMASLA